MISQYVFELSSNNDFKISAATGYRLYGMIMRLATPEFAETVHQQSMTPISQYVCATDGNAIWTVNLLGRYAENELCDAVSELTECVLDDGNIISIRLKAEKHIDSFNEIMNCSCNKDNFTNLKFETPTAFKSQGRYVYIPNERLIIQNLVKKWNACIEDCYIEDEDNEGINSIISSVSIERFNIYDSMFRLKGSPIQGFCGDMVLRNRNKGFHKELCDALLYISQYTGIGIKTTLGMGGTRIVVR